MEFVLANVFGIDSVIVVVVAVVVLFGGSQIPKLARGLGQAKNEFEKAQKGDKVAEEEKPAVKVEVQEPPKTPEA